MDTTKLPSHADARKAHDGRVARLWGARIVGLRDFPTPADDAEPFTGMRRHVARAAARAYRRHLADLAAAAGGAFRPRTIQRHLAQWASHSVHPRRWRAHAGDIERRAREQGCAPLEIRRQVAVAESVEALAIFDGEGDPLPRLRRFSNQLTERVSAALGGRPRERKKRPDAVSLERAVAAEGGRLAAYEDQGAASAFRRAEARVTLAHLRARLPADLVETLEILDGVIRGQGHVNEAEAGRRHDPPVSGQTVRNRLNRIANIMA